MTSGFRDRASISISLVALVVAISSAIFTHQQYSLNAARDAREQKQYRDDRTPLVSATAARPGPQRRFIVTFDITNRQFNEASLEKIRLSGPADGKYYGFGPFNPPSDQGRFSTRSAGGGPPSILTLIFSNSNLGVGEKATLPCYVDISDEIGIPGGSTVNFEITFRLDDNSDTRVTVNRSVALNR